MASLETQLLDAPLELLGHLVGTSRRYDGDRPKTILIAAHQVGHPVVDTLAECQTQAAIIHRWNIHGGGKENLPIDALARDGVQARLHIVAADLPFGELAAAPLGLRIEHMVVVDAGARLRANGIEAVKKT